MTIPEKSTILIVDDDRGGRDALEALLLTQDYSLVLASNGSEALRKLTETPVDLLLLDVMMPGMDGYEVCRRIRATPALADIPVLMLTALNDYRSRLAGFEAGADDYINKPYDSTELFARVRTITRLNRYRRLVAERSKFQQLFALSPNGQMVVDASGVIQLINEKTLELLNIRTAAEIEGSRLAQWIEEDNREEFQAIFEKCLAQPTQSFNLDAGLTHKDYQSQPVELLLGRIEYNGQSMIQVIVIDIRERLQMAGALSRERILLRTLVDSLPDYFYVKDLESRILMANSALACLFGFESPDDMIGKTDFDIYPEELAERYFSEEKQILASGKPILDREEPLIDAYGNWLVFSITKAPLYNLKNEVIGLMGIGRDVTRQNNVLRDLDSTKARQKAANFLVEELKQALYEKEQEERLAVRSVGDQFGSLARRIGALAALMSKKDQDQAGLAESIQETAAIMQKTAGDILAYSRLEAGEKIPEPKTFSIADCIQAAVDEASPAASEKQLPIKVEINSALPERALGDGDGLCQIFSRLLRNAIRVTEVGEIKLSAGLENYSSGQFPNQLFFHAAVSDCGKSLTKKDIPGLFSPYHHPATGNDVSDDLGLDLAICKYLVQQAGGGIWVENYDEPGQGSIIHFSYPLAAA